MFLLVLYIYAINILSILGLQQPIITCYFQWNNPSVSYFEENLCTHYNLIGSCTIDESYHIVLPNSTIIATLKEWLNGQLANPKLLITLTPINNRMSYLVKKKKLREKLIEDVKEYLIINQVSGFDIDWEFPVWSSDAEPTDKEGLSILIKELRESLNQAKSNLLLSLAVAAPAIIVDKAYDVKSLNKYLDYVQIMNYDFHMYNKLQQPWTGFNAPLFHKLYEFGIFAKMNSDYSTQHWLRKGLWANKTVFGIPTYGRGYTLLTKYLHFLYAPATGHASLGVTYPFSKVCNLAKTGKYKYLFDEKTRSAYIYGDDRQWLGFEDPITMFSKASYIRAYNLAGIMIYDLASDDYMGVCKRGRYPLIKAAKAAIESKVMEVEKEK
uniref:GH18 domain-containing protein n=1 Tax=Setaria digitata TaxID=48799 RepID=A0A915PSW8_9BILA